MRWPRYISETAIAMRDKLAYLLAEVANGFVVLVEDNADFVHKSVQVSQCVKMSEFGASNLICSSSCPSNPAELVSMLGKRRNMFSAVMGST